MNTKRHYEKYWGSKETIEEFFSYERNYVLPQLFNKNEKVLDLGCGDGVMAEFLKNKLGVDVVGYDISEKAAKLAARRGIKVFVGNVEEKLPFKKRQFDVVFWGDNMEHLFDPVFTLRQIRRILKKNGRLVLSCPNMGYWRYRLYYFLKGELQDTEWSGNPPWSWSHIRFFNINLIKKFLKSESFEIKRIIGVNRRRLDKYLTKIYPPLFAMIVVVEARLVKRG